MDASTIPIVSADDVHRYLPMSLAIAALSDALRSGLRPEDCPARSSTAVRKGSFLVMPSEDDDYAGIKVLTVAHDNTGTGMPPIQGLYLLFDSGTLRPLAMMDAAALTAIRTPAVSALAIDRLARAEASSLVIFGTGLQAEYHVKAIGSVRHLKRITVVGRTLERTEAFVAALRAEGHYASGGVAADVADADIILCCTTSSLPVFEGKLVRADAVVVAMGSHSPVARETDDALAERSTIYVEDVQTALREAGDVIMGVENGTIAVDSLQTLSSLVRVGPRPRQGPAFFKGVGMGWQDLVVCRAVYEAMRPTA